MSSKISSILKNETDDEIFFFKYGMSCLNKGFDENNILATHHRKFRAGFGVSPKVCSIVWREIDEDYHKLEREHLLWALHFLKVYSTENVLTSVFSVDEKTYRNIIFKVIDSISILTEDVVSLITSLLLLQLFFKS